MIIIMRTMNDENEDNHNDGVELYSSIIVASDYRIEIQETKTKLYKTPRCAEHEEASCSLWKHSPTNFSLYFVKKSIYKRLMFGFFLEL